MKGEVGFVPRIEAVVNVVTVVIIVDVMAVVNAGVFESRRSRRSR